MKPRYAQEDHTHDGLGTVAVWRGWGLQMGVALYGGDTWGPRREDRWCQENVNDSVPAIKPSLLSALASDLPVHLESGNDSVLTYPSSLRHQIQFGGFALGNHRACFSFDETRTEDVRIRWRFGTNSAWDGVWSGDGVPEAGWGAFIAGDGTATGAQGYAVVDDPATYAVARGWDVADHKYDISGGSLVEDVGWSPGTVYDSPADAFIGVGPASGLGITAGNLIIAAKTTTTSGHVEHVVDLGLTYTPGDLVTWDLTWTVADPTVVAMKVWVQSKVTDTPVSAAVRDVPAAWVPFTSMLATAHLSGYAANGSETTSFLYWHGMLLPRASNAYELPVADPIGGPWSVTVPLPTFWTEGGTGPKTRGDDGTVLIEVSDFDYGDTGTPVCTITLTPTLGATPGGFTNPKSWWSYSASAYAGGESLQHNVATVQFDDASVVTRDLNGTAVGVVMVWIGSAFSGSYPYSLSASDLALRCYGNWG